MGSYNPEDYTYVWEAWDGTNILWTGEKTSDWPEHQEWIANKGKMKNVILKCTKIKKKE